MGRLWICLALFAVSCVLTKAQSDEDVFPDYWNDDYGSFDDYGVPEENMENELDENLEKLDIESDNKVKEEIKQFRELNEENNAAIEEDDSFKDYQFEDNRSKDREDLDDDLNEDVANDSELQDSDPVNPVEDGQVKSVKGDDNKEQKNIDDTANDYALLWGDIQEENALANVNESEKKLIDETKAILEETEDNDFGNDNQAIERADIDESLLEETKKILEESDNDFDNIDDSNKNKNEIKNNEVSNKISANEQKIEQTTLKNDSEENSPAEIQKISKEVESINTSSENNNKDENDEEDTIDKVYEDLNEDLDKLFENLNKLSEDEDKNENDDVNMDVSDYEENQEGNKNDIVNDIEKQPENHKEAIFDAQKPLTNNLEENNDLETDVGIEAKHEDHPTSEENIDEDTVDKEYADLNADLDKLFESIDKLTDDDYEENEDERLHDALNMDVKDYEEKYGRPYREGLVLSQRDYENIDDSNLSEIFAKHDKENASNEIENKDDIKGNDEILDNPIDELVDSEPNADDAAFEDVIISALNETKKEPLVYVNDAFVNDEKKKDDTQTTEEPQTEHSVQSVKVDELSSGELDELMDQFKAVHEDEINPHSKNFETRVQPIPITLYVEKPTIVTSPNHPGVYPTNNIVDWIFEGAGVGIELNITEFAVNGALGDYVLVIPGGVDATNTDGLVFSYRLTSERRFRFMDVDKMFVRFQSYPGMSFLRGFRFSVKMISYLPNDPVPIPHPDPVLPKPRETMTLTLGGVTLSQFREVEDEFRQLIADMAAEYIIDNNIAPGINTTSEMTRIMDTDLCNIKWPEFDNCAQIVFGVPLVYEDEDQDYRLKKKDLETMWRTYITRDPFALRLRRMGISEFSIPDDSSVLTVWLVIAGGVVISMAMLAFALWRFSCFEDYTRMKAYSDTDSLQNEKRGLDLYPTPHQTLPPLYSESEYKWADDKFDDDTRVDMGGFANNSFMRDELYNFDSEEEVITPRDRFTTDV